LKLGRASARPFLSPYPDWAVRNTMGAEIHFRKAPGTLHIKAFQRFWTCDLGI